LFYFVIRQIIACKKESRALFKTSLLELDIPLLDIKVNL